MPQSMNSTPEGVKTIWCPMCDEYEIDPDKMRAALPVPPSAPAWRPISEAPRDGTPIDIWVDGFPSRRVVNMKWDEHEYGFRNAVDPDQGWMEDETASGWMPLPSPHGGEGEGK